MFDTDVINTPVDRAQRFRTKRLTVKNKNPPLKNVTNPRLIDSFG